MRQVIEFFEWGLDHKSRSISIQVYMLFLAVLLVGSFAVGALIGLAINGYPLLALGIILLVASGSLPSLIRQFRNRQTDKEAG